MLFRSGTETAGTVTTGSLTGLVSGESLTVSTTASDYATANVGTHSTTITHTLGNATGGGTGTASNYSLTNASASVNGQITAKSLTIGAPSITSRAYNGSTTAGALTVGSLSGLVGSETLGVTGSAAAYTSANVGSYTVTVTYTLKIGRAHV